ncbi:MULTISPECIES: hypothetical protein [unclassified Lysinibacillus]|uniref:hypothetical protein n=1 Tax=unclassified Lysinibacillus TaxID=2636778 RepID=UPI002012CB90|nr:MULTISPECIES: hypothetical protein [unclassified Lysinibacillus]MCL1696796.1 hypothetical protein [Lysinibacillus sp. BPa_S21]MCL1700339.1 hypothetical protein [Lysinibacillus sp. Bpr_S20]
MKTKKLLFSALAATFILGAGYTTASASTAEEPSNSITPRYVPVDAYISPKLVTLNTSSSSVTKTIGWGGGVSSYYNVSYNDGYTSRTFTADFYSTTHTRTYSLSKNDTTRTWDNYLSVTNGNTASATGSVTLRR